MKRLSRSFAPYLWTLLGCAIAAACASSSGAGSETHFACTRDSDCNRGSACIEGQCVPTSAGGRDAGSGRGAHDAGAKDGAPEPVLDTGVPMGCAAVSAGPLGGTFDAQSLPARSAALTWTGDGFVGVWPATDQPGFHVSAGEIGANNGSSRTIWQAYPSSGAPSIAVASNVLAVVDQASEGPGARQICRLGMARYPDLTSIREPARYSDPPDDASVKNEAFDCHVASAGTDFAVVFRAYTSSTDPDWAVYLDHYGTDGLRVGNRLTLDTGSELQDKVDGVSIASSGSVLAVAYSLKAGVSVKLVTGASVKTVRLALSGPPQITFAHEQFIVTAGDQLVALDPGGRTLAGPISLGGAAVAPLGHGWVEVSHDEYLVAQAFDGDFNPTSAPVGLSDDRRATAAGLFYGPDGASTFVAISDASGMNLRALDCGSNPGPPPGPAACPTTAVVDPLDDGCTDAVCHVAIRLDYLTLAPKGWASTGGPMNVVDATTAGTAAADVFARNCMYCGSDRQVTTAAAGLYRVFVSPSDSGAFALVGARSGKVVVAGGVAWAGRGSYFAPTTWNSASDIRCGSASADAQEKYFDSNGCDSFDGKTGASAGDAFTVAMRTNLAQAYANNGDFSAYVYLYTPSVGACDPAVAEYIVVLSR